MHEPFVVTTTQLAGRTVIAISGELDLSRCEELTGVLDVALRVGPGTGITIDLREMSFCDSSGLTVLLRAMRQAALRRVDLVMTRPPGPAWRAFEICGLDTVLPFVDGADLDAALMLRAG